MEAPALGEPQRWASGITIVEGYGLEFHWPSLFFAPPLIVVGVVLPAWLLILVFRYGKLSTLKKLLLVPVCIIGPFLWMLFWPLVLQLSGLIRMTPDGSPAPYLWVANELFGDWSEYVWVGITTAVFFIIHYILNRNNYRSVMILVWSDNSKIIIVLNHVILGILGIYNLFFRGSYFVNAWKSLHAQGVGHLYFIIMTLATSWWLIGVVIMCFMGNFCMPKPDDKIGFKGFIMPLLGAALSIVLPPFMLSGWFIAIVWFRSLL